MMKVEIKVTLVSLLLAITQLWAEDKTCPADGVYVQVLGSGGPELSDGLASSSYAVWDNGKIRVLVDTGTGSAEHFGQTGQAFANVELILYSHFHTDHSADFPALIKNAFFEGRTNDLWVYGPTGTEFFPSTEQFVNRMIGKDGAFSYLSSYLTGNASYQIHPQSVRPSERILLLKKQGIKLSSIDAEHGPLPSLAWSVEMKGKKMTFSGDNGGHSNHLIKLAKKSDLLVVHNAIPEETFGVARRLHMPPSRIGQVAQQSKTKHLVLSHFMNRTRNKKAATQQQIEQYYRDKLTFTRDMQCLSL